MYTNFDLADEQLADDNFHGLALSPIELTQISNRSLSPDITSLSATLFDTLNNFHDYNKCHDYQNLTNYYNPKNASNNFDSIERLNNIDSIDNVDVIDKLVDEFHTELKELDVGMCQIPEIPSLNDAFPACTNYLQNDIKIPESLFDSIENPNLTSSLSSPNNTSIQKIQDSLNNFSDTNVLNIASPRSDESNLNCPLPDIKIQQNLIQYNVYPLPNGRDMTFEEAYSNDTLYLMPTALKLLPEKYWESQPKTLTFKQLVDDYFKQTRNNNATFMLKLYNLLMITSNVPMLEKAIGIKWVSPRVIEVSRLGLVNIFKVRESTVDGAMFHRQGNFSTHQFVEIGEVNYKKYEFYEYPNIEKIPGDTKFFIHEPRVFTHRIMTEHELRTIRYSNEAKKNYRSKIIVQDKFQSS
ncbi:hypothetical protein TRFO_18916 [Tritrichomonas foetus]|uniref:Uncharacterized protein n=1 Tax=Tritrichomonas foetus TaxID=1144522 RepID=A0A1J4KJT6_9EUKA|nr:hypothetical protein TRFO_18916 [Tritrichomonas foetus]|eukprot:OHT11561.1 hypothetical protein TRFO_18916 [Tritrichomonas foetus]